MQPSTESFETAFVEGDEAVNDERTRQRGALQELIASRTRHAVDARMNSGIETIWLEDDDQYNGIEFDDTPANQAPSAKSTTAAAVQAAMSKRSRIYVNITKPKTDVGTARVQELLVPHDDKPWDISPTPVPEIDEAIAANDQEQVQLADGAMVPRADAARAMVEKAKMAAEKMADHIEDKFVEGRIYREWRRAIHDAGRIGTGVVKGPFPFMREDRKWDAATGTVTITKTLTCISKAISVWDCFPDPSCGENHHDGAFFVERDYLTGRSVRGLARLPDYDPVAIAEILKEGPRTGGRYDDRYRREKPGQVGTFDSDTFETFYYYGDIPPQVLVAGGWVIKGLLDAETDEELKKQADLALELTTVPVVVTVINERIVRITMNPLETGEFPFDFFVWEPVEGQPWGRGIPRKMAAAQKMLNAATRAMLENAGMSAGPQVVMNKRSITPANGRYEITGRKLYYWEPDENEKDPDVRKAFGVFNIPTAQEQLQSIIQYALEMADQLTNLPLMMQGDMGAAPDTVGGMAMLEANAVSPLRVIAKQFDDALVIPHIGRYYAWLMQDERVPTEAKGDMQIRARGASALILRDLYAQLLPQLMPFVKDPAFELDPKKYIEQLLRSNKLDPRMLQLTKEQAEAQAQAAAENPPVDPKVQAAQITAQQRDQQHQSELADRQQQREHEAKEAALDREADVMVKSMELEIQTMEFAGEKEVSLEQVRAMLAKAAMDIKNKREMFVAERQFAETTGEGRGL